MITDMDDIDGYAVDDRNEENELESKLAEPRCPRCGSRRFHATVLMGSLYEIAVRDGGDDWTLERSPSDEGHRILQDVWCRECKTRMDDEFTGWIARRQGAETLGEASG